MHTKGKGRGKAKCVQLRTRGVGGVGGGGEGSRLRTYTKKFFLHLKVSKRFFFGTKEAITLPFIIEYRKL